MCPKLVGEVRSEDREVRVNALGVLCEELQNPLNVLGFVQAGVVHVLNQQVVSDDDSLTRQRASKALEVCSRDSNGVEAMLEAKTASLVSHALDDEVAQVRHNVYTALVQLSTDNYRGVAALVDAGYPTFLVEKAKKEEPFLQPRVLGLLRNCLRNEKGLQDALDKLAVETCVSFLTSSEDDEVKRQSSVTLTTLCFVSFPFHSIICDLPTQAEIAKITAIESDAVPALIKLLQDEKESTRAAASGALMVITTTDEGKRRMVTEAQGEAIRSVTILANLLDETNTTLKLNSLKCIANVAVHPRARAQMTSDNDFLTSLDSLCDSSNTLISKHALIAKKAVLWTP